MSLRPRLLVRLGLALAVALAPTSDVAARPKKGVATKQTTKKKKAAPPVVKGPPPQVVVGPAAGKIGSASYAAGIACQQTLQEQLARLPGATTGLYVADAKTGEVLFSHGETKALNPASNTKLISTGTALALLGPDYRYATRIVGATPVDGVVDGGIYLRGNYDPTLDTGDIAALAESVADAGIRKIGGAVFIGNPATRDAIYGAGYNVRVAAGKVGKAPSVSLSPALPGIVVVNRASTTGKRRGSISVRTEAGQDASGAPITKVIVSGTVRKNRAVNQHIAPKHVGRFTAELLRLKLAARGVEVAGPVEIRAFDEFVAGLAEKGALAMDLAVHESAPLASIIATVNKRSVNWLADRVIYTAAAIAAGAEPARARAVDAMYAWLETSIGAERSSMFIDTGSGLSYETRISAQQIAAVLRAAGGYSQLLREGSAQAFRESLAVGGQDGTLRARFKTSLKGRVIGKTGTLNPVIALAGFITSTSATASGRELVFVIVSNELSPRQHTVAKAAHERMVKALADYMDGDLSIDTEAAEEPDGANGINNDEPVSEPQDVSDELPTDLPADTQGTVEEELPATDPAQL